MAKPLTTTGTIILIKILSGPDVLRDARYQCVFDQDDSLNRLIRVSFTQPVLHDSIKGSLKAYLSTRDGTDTQDSASASCRRGIDVETQEMERETEIEDIEVPPPLLQLCVRYLDIW